MNKTSSRGPDLDIEACTEAVGGNRFNLVIIAASRAREISKKYKQDEDFTKMGAPLTALLEIQEKKLKKK